MEENAVNNREEFVHEEGEVYLSGPMRFRDLFAFRLKYSYLGLNGLAYWILTALVIGLLVFNWNGYEVKTRVLLFAILGFLLIYFPGNTALRTLQYTSQMKAEGIVISYYVNRNGILVKQGEQEEVISWDMVRKVKETRKRFFLYIMKNSAFVFPKDLLKEQTEVLRAFIKEGMKRA